MSITLAAGDLCLTQSAVSRQIHALEESLGRKLLKRSHRAIGFTPEGERFFRVADIALQQLQDAMGVLDNRHEGRPVAITASIGVTGLWLLPRLVSLQQLHPDIDVRVAASDKMLDLRDESVDIAIRYCAEGAHTVDAFRLFAEEVLPVAHPSLCKAGVLLSEVLAGKALLEFDDPRRPWLQWADRLGALGLGTTRGHHVLHFNQYDQVIYAALAGQGIALGRKALIEPMLRDGRLVALDWGGRPKALEHAYWLMIASPKPRASVAKIAQWIMNEAGHP